MAQGARKPTPPSTTAAPHRRFREHEVVTTLRAVREDDVVVPEGSVGTVVHAYPNDEAYVVEFGSPDTRIVTVRGDLLGSTSRS